MRLKAQAIAPSDDTRIPESIYIVLGKSEDLFDGKTFISFVSQDKESGVARYEVAEKFFGEPNASDWQEAVSPYEVKDKTLLKKIYVKSVDGAGNERVGIVNLPNRKYGEVFVVIIILAVCTLYVRRSRARS